jgi:hypothetical protein
MTKPAAWFLQLAGLGSLVFGIANKSGFLILLGLGLVALGGWGIRRRLKS